MVSDTIFAPASGYGLAAICVIRISGGRSGAVLKAMIRGALPKPREAKLVRICDPASGRTLDRGLVLWFPAPASFTGEDMLEFQVHGGRAVAQSVLEVLSRQEGLRLAEPGEFCRRAFDNGKMDLTELEGLADLIAAETEAQRVQAMRQMEGELGRVYECWRERLLTLLAYLEAEIDFADQDLPSGLMAGFRSDLSSLLSEITCHLDDQRRGERLREGVFVTILGPPNVGKSSLINALARKDVAIVSSIGGTTRDVIEVHLDIGGYPVILADTAGLRECGDEIVAESVRRTMARAKSADLKLVVLSLDLAPSMCLEALRLCDADSLLVLNKADLSSTRADFEGELRRVFDGPFPEKLQYVSVKEDDGLSDVVARLHEMVKRRVEGVASGAPALTRQRHRMALEDCRSGLRRCLRVVGSDLQDRPSFDGRGAVGSGLFSELLAEDLRLAARSLGRITGRVDVEDILDVIFRDFCIGK